MPTTIEQARRNAFTPTPRQAAAWRQPTAEQLAAAGVDVPVRIPVVTAPAPAGAVTVAQARANAFTVPAGRGMSYRAPVAPAIVTQAPVVQTVPKPSAQALARAEAAASAPGLVDRVSQFVQGAFPTINAVRTDGTAAQDLADGNIARGVGGLIRKAGGYIAAGGTDLIGAPAANLGSAVGGIARGVLGGVVASDGTGPSTVVRNLLPKAVAPAAKDPVAKALAQGAAAKQDITPQDKLITAINGMIDRGATMNEVSAIGNILPGLTKPAQTAKDALFGQTAALSQVIHAKQTDAIAKALAAGEITPEQADNGIQQATEAYFARNGGLVGFDPTKLAQARMLQGGGEE